MCLLLQYLLYESIFEFFSMTTPTTQLAELTRCDIFLSDADSGTLPVCVVFKGM